MASFISEKEHMCQLQAAFEWLCKDEKEKLREKQQKAHPWVTLMTSWNPHGLRAGRRLGNGHTSHCWVTDHQLSSAGAHSPTLMWPSLALSLPQNSSCIPLEAGITAAFSAHFWLTTWLRLQSARYCSKRQPLVPLVPWPSQIIWASRGLPEGQACWQLVPPGKRSYFKLSRKKSLYLFGGSLSILTLKRKITNGEINQHLFRNRCSTGNEEKQQQQQKPHPREESWKAEDVLGCFPITGRHTSCCYSYIKVLACKFSKCVAINKLF